MEIINIEARTFEAMMSKFEIFVQKVEKMYKLYGKDECIKWLDSQEVCNILSISKRTLQTLRDNGTLAYTQINHKIYYNAVDIESIILKGKKRGGKK